MSLASGGPRRKASPLNKSLDSSPYCICFLRILKVVFSVLVIDFEDLNVSSTFFAILIKQGNYENACRLVSLGHKSNQSFGYFLIALKLTLCKVDYGIKHHLKYFCLGHSF